GVMPLPGRALTSLFVCYNGKAILIDCGEGTQIELRRNKLKYSHIDTILLTHFHGDHVCGMTGLLLSFGLDGRTAPLKIYGPKGLQEIVKSFLVVAPGLPYEIICEEITGNHTEFKEIGLTVNAFKLRHSVDCYGYRLDLSRSPKFDPEKAKALNIPLEYWKTLQKGESVGEFNPKDIFGENRRGISILYATDTRPVQNIITYGNNLDLMILESMYNDDECQEKAEEKSHLSMKEAVSLAKTCQPNALWLTHFSPAMLDPYEHETEVKLEFENTVIGYDGLSTTLNFKEI
ncbi:MAG: ribonuclease Z, partial [Clostridia bacterium]|nr:ribonuclease Z [Clostridia bacterium]